MQEFDRNGAYLAQWPVVGWESEAPVNKPYLAIGSQRSVYVTQPDYHRVVKFNGGGQVLAMWGQYGSNDQGLSTPSGIAVDAAGFIYVADSGNNRVVKYAPVN